jgi:alpha-tubulin suppressor-like RCC1 family protein
MFAGVSHAVRVSGLTFATAVAVGSKHACALRSSGEVTCWGAGADGQLGNGTATPQQPTPVSVSNVSGFTAIVAGAAHTCALRADHTVWCWGSNQMGQLGIGSLAMSSSAVPLQVPGLNDAVAIGSGQFAVCAVRATGSVVCWGSAAGGVLGPMCGSCGSSPAPLAIGVSGAAAADVGYQYGCALLRDHSLVCWGDNSVDQLGSTLMTTQGPVAIPALSGVSAVATGDTQVCALLSSGAVDCWGESWGHGTSGNAANGAGQTSAVPTPTPNLGSAVEVAVGANSACAVLAGGSVKCWGDNVAAELGSGSTNNSTTPVDVTW